MSRITTVTVECKCGREIFRYHKTGTGRLVKCYLSKITFDNIGLKSKMPVGTEVFCPECKNRIGTIQMIHGQPAVKLNQGQIQPIHIA